MRSRDLAAFTVLIAVLAHVASGDLAAQQPARRVLPEFRVDVTSGDVSSAQIAAGVHLTTGTYFRLAFLAGAGTAWADDDRGGNYRVEVQGRFHLDPFRSAPIGLYGIGGVTTSHDPFARWQSRLVVGAGAELPAHGRATFAIEAALAGGLRISMVLRRVPLGRR